ncbi:MAG: hypothetical protein RL757_2452 [Bacteroidota bacterium]|jgi:hypothetical protein
MKKNIITSSLLLLLIFTLHGQGFNRVYRLDSNVAYGILSAVPTDTAIYVKAMTNINQNGVWFAGGNFAKFNINGDLVASKLHGDTNNTFLLPYNNLKKVNDTTFYCTGHQNTAFSIGASIVFIAEFNERGDTIWYKEFNGIEYNSSYLFTTDCVRDASGNFYVFVNRYSTRTLDDNDFFIVKVNRRGERIWYRYFNDVGFDIHGSKISFDNQGYLWAKAMKFKDYITDWTHKAIGVTFRLDTAGNILNRFETDTSQLNTTVMTVLRNGDYLLHGDIKIQYAYSSDGGVTFEPNPRYHQHGYVARYNQQGQLMWEHTIRRNGTLVQAAVENPDGSIVVAGNTRDSLPGSEYGNNISGLLVKYTANGDSLWARMYQGLPHLDDVKGFFSSIHRLFNGGYILGGNCDDFIQRRSTAGIWGWLVRTDSFGCVQRNCQLTNLSPPPPQYNVPVSVFPNPAQGRVTFAWQSQLPPFGGIEGGLILFDVSGKAVLQQQILGGSTETSIDVSTLPNSMYLYKIQFDNGAQAVGKLVVAK